MGNKKEQILFIHRLRGIAACMVLFWHLGVMFWMANEVVAAAFPLKGFPEASAKLPYIVSHIYGIISKYGVEFGMFGVALFFLISGYIIPYSLRGGGAG